MAVQDTFVSVGIASSALHEKSELSCRLNIIVISLQLPVEAVAMVWNVRHPL